MVEYENAHVHISDLGLQRGYGVFEYYHVYDNRPFWEEEYLTRLYQSARLINLEIPFSIQEIQSFVAQLIAANNLTTSSIRIVITGGYSEDGYTPSKSNLIITNTSVNIAPTHYHLCGAVLLIQAHKREIPKAKTTNYLQSVSLIAKMKQDKAVDVLYHDNSLVREASRCNIFTIKEGIISTPSSEILEGVTRKVLINSLANLGIHVITKDISLDELHNADEVFITSTSKRIMPIIKIGDLIVGDGNVGKYTQEISSVFNKVYSL
jgi:D-alanine transaminase/branched-chain amino acid aminotransferase